MTLKNLVIHDINTAFPREKENLNNNFTELRELLRTIEDPVILAAVIGITLSGCDHFISGMSFMYQLLKASNEKDEISELESMFKKGDIQ